MIVGMKVLIVEDDLALGDALGRVLQARGFEVTRCADGGEALAMFRRRSHDVVLLDLSLPGMDGMEVLRLMRDGGSSVPVLVMTARGAVQDRVLGLNEGADDYLTKPFDIEELAARLKALVRRSHGAPELRCALLRVDGATGVVYRGAAPLTYRPASWPCSRRCWRGPDRRWARKSCIAPCSATRRWARMRSRCWCTACASASRAPAPSW